MATVFLILLSTVSWVTVNIVFGTIVTVKVMTTFLNPLRMTAVDGIHKFAMLCLHLLFYSSSKVRRVTPFC